MLRKSSQSVQVFHGTFMKNYERTHLYLSIRILGPSNVMTPEEVEQEELPCLVQGFKPSGFAGFTDGLYLETFRISDMRIKELKFHCMKVIILFCFFSSMQKLPKGLSGGKLSMVDSPIPKGSSFSFHGMHNLVQAKIGRLDKSTLLILDMFSWQGFGEISFVFGCIIVWSNTLRDIIAWRQQLLNIAILHFSVQLFEYLTSEYCRSYGIIPLAPNLWPEASMKRRSAPN